MPEKSACGLQTTTGENIALQSVNVAVDFNNLLCETVMTQAYQNQGKNPIEAVYTFPLASRAVLLDLNVTIGDRILQGAVVKKASAEEQYEEAITDGDAAILLEQIQEGLYAMNVGNILPDEEISITIKYIELYSWQGDTLRFYLPTTIAPRYGNPEGVGLQPHQTPEYDLLAENRLQLKIKITGTLANADIESPSHPIALTKSLDGIIVTLASGETFMDRDFILNIHSSQIKKDTALVECDPDGRYVALASFAPQLPAPDKTPPRSIKIVVDCSGSMAGDSIAQARQAISDILSHLRPEDCFNLITFGNHYKTVFKKQVKANKENIITVKRQLRSLDADMGGTEIQQALQAAIQLPGPAIPQDILLITDGEVWESDQIIHMAKKSGHRVFTVGVGSSVSESFVRQLAKETGGACELVAPREKMTEKIVRHFNRIYLPRAEIVKVLWPITPEQTIPHDIGPVFDGDTLHVFACFKEKPCGSVILDMTMADGRTFSSTAVIEDREKHKDGDGVPRTIPRLAISQAIINENEKNATDLAVKYQLICPYTSYIVVDVRDDESKAKEGLPTLSKVPQMMAAGWGGTGTVVRECNRLYDAPMFSKSAPDLRIRCQQTSTPEVIHKRKQATTPDVFIHKCNQLHTNWLWPVLQIVSFSNLLDCHLPDRILAVLTNINDEQAPHISEEFIVVIFLCTLEQTVVGKEFSRNFRHAVKKRFKQLRPEERIVNMMNDAFADIGADDWGTKYPPEN